MKCPTDAKTSVDCVECQIKHGMPHYYCCLMECHEHEFCRNCKVVIKKG